MSFLSKAFKSVKKAVSKVTSGPIGTVLSAVVPGAAPIIQGLNTANALLSSNGIGSTPQPSGNYSVYPSASQPISPFSTSTVRTGHGEKSFGRRVVPRASNNNVRAKTSGATPAFDYSSNNPMTMDQINSEFQRMLGPRKEPTAPPPSYSQFTARLRKDMLALDE